MTTKTCTKCGACKPLDAFYKHIRMRDGLSGYCKQCDAERAAARYAANPEAQALRNAAYYAAHRDELLAKQPPYAERKRRRLAARMAALGIQRKEAE